MNQMKLSLLVPWRSGGQREEDAEIEERTSHAALLLRLAQDDTSVPARAVLSHIRVIESRAVNVFRPRRRAVQNFQQPSVMMQGGDANALSRTVFCCIGAFNDHAFRALLRAYIDAAGADHDITARFYRFTLETLGFLLNVIYAPLMPNAGMVNQVGRALPP